MDVLLKLIETLLYFVPALIVLGAVYMIIKKFFEKEYKLRLLEVKAAAQKDSLALRFQAYERMCLFLERISPNNLLPRVNRSGISARELHAELLISIRAEMEHNLSQQVYVSSKAWEMLKSAKEETIKTINLAGSSLPDGASGVQLNKAIFDILIRNDKIPTQKALEFIKNEARQLY